MAARTVQVGGQLRVQANGHIDPVQANAGPPLLELLDDLRDRPAVVTGAARGIGEAIAKWLIMAGADVTVIDKDAESLKDAFRTEDCQVIEADLHKEDVVGLADELTRNGPVELLVNNVGITTPHELLEVGAPELDLVLGTNLRGPWLFTDRLVKALIEDRAGTPDRSPRRRGSILFISSLHDRYVAREAHYSVSKAGVAMLVQAMAKELGRYRIRVNAISPGWIRTAEDLNTPLQVAKEARLRPRIPAGLAGVPADVARVALFLLSDAWSGYVTGQNIAVDGGLSLHNFLDE
jgi:NAD(P)-dependent dehydrogenase (short-subunit alcohol dehydrogenase family)